MHNPSAKGLLMLKNWVVIAGTAGWPSPEYALWAKDNQLSIVDCSQICCNFAIGELFADENDRRFLHT